MHASIVDQIVNLALPNALEHGVCRLGHARQVLKVADDRDHLPLLVLQVLSQLVELLLGASNGVNGCSGLHQHTREFFSKACCHPRDNHVQVLHRVRGGSPGEGRKKMVVMFVAWLDKRPLYDQREYNHDSGFEHLCLFRMPSDNRCKKQSNFLLLLVSR